MNKLKQNGFTLIEIVMVIAILGVLAVIVYAITVPNWKQRTYYSRSISELNTMQNAFKLYLAKYNDYPPDENRNVPAGIKEFIQSQAGSEAWPEAPFPGSVYDYDNWPPDSNGPEHTYQISIRFCNLGESNAVCKANAKKYLSSYVDAATLDAWDSQSSMYYCLKGSCRSHQSKPMNHPGYCVNCGDKSQIF
ncbi:type II secretion system protein [Candidatus Saccharibacteria bacterium]|nr:type II secretion system protein [Candidatus Saccharibacteria bacterium]